MLLSYVAAMMMPPEPRRGTAPCAIRKYGCSGHLGRYTCLIETAASARGGHAIYFGSASST
jgi:hypothetical protein